MAELQSFKINLYTVRVFEGDLTQWKADAIVNSWQPLLAAGSLHRAVFEGAGSGLVSSMATSYPEGLLPGTAVSTDGFRLPARHIIHAHCPPALTAQPIYAGQLLRQTWTWILRCANQLGIRHLAIPVLGAGKCGWDAHQAFSVAWEALLEEPSSVRRVDFVIPPNAHSLKKVVSSGISKYLWLTILRAVRVLHQRGYTGVHVLPYDGPLGPRLEVAAVRYTQKPIWCEEWDKTCFLRHRPWGDPEMIAERATWEISGVTTPEQLADMILKANPIIRLFAPDREWAVWYARFLEFLESIEGFPRAIYEYMADDLPGWEVEGRSGIDYFPFPPGWSA